MKKRISFAGNLSAEIIEAGTFVPESGNEVYFLDGGTFGWLENEN